MARGGFWVVVVVVVEGGGARTFLKGARSPPWLKAFGGWRTTLEIAV